MNNVPLVSVIIPCYNASKYLIEALDSIIQQSYKNLEIIITDDCSTDNTYEMLCSFREKDSRIKLYKNDVNLKLPTTLNNMIDLCTGKYIARMDADDISLKNRIKEQVVYLEKHPEIDMCGTNAWNMKENGKIVGFYKFPINDTAIKYSACIFNPFFHSSVMLKAEVLKLNKYNSNFRYSQDYELWIRIMKSYKVHNLSKKLIIYRLPEMATPEKKEKQKQLATNVIQEARHAFFKESFNLNDCSISDSYMFYRLAKKEGFMINANIVHLVGYQILRCILKLENIIVTNFIIMQKTIKRK